VAAILSCVALLSANERAGPDRAYVLRTHGAIGLPDQAARVRELAEVRPVNADGEELVAVGIRAEGIAARVEHDTPSRRVQAKRHAR